jgi:galactose mutarotase-like enzyme
MRHAGMNPAEHDPNLVQLAAGPATATLALQGAEPMTWQVGGHDLLWHGDPAHWSFRAPILVPVVGASSGGVVRVDGQAYPMPQHGFARGLPFALVAAERDSAHLRLADTPETRLHFPFAFVLDITVALTPASLQLTYAVTNRDAAVMPYAIGFHPAFAWPFDGGERTEYRVVFGEPEAPRLPGVTDAALLVPHGRPSPVADRILALDPDAFTEAFVFLEARSRSLAFEAPSGAAIKMAVEGYPHLAIWTKPTAPFLSLEAWTGHADWHGFAGELAQRASMRLLAPGETGRHTVVLTWRDAPDRG